MLERDIVKQIIIDLRNKGYVVYKTWGNIYEIAGRADITGVHPDDGRRVEIEVKARRGKLAHDQMKFLQVMAAHGAITSACDDPESALVMLPCACGQKGFGNICFYCGDRK